MNAIKATITEIESEDLLHIVSFKSGTSTLKMMSLELDPTLQKESSVLLGIKATAIALAKHLEGTLSYSNQISMQIKEIEQGKLLSSIKLQNEAMKLESIITTASLQRMGLAVGESIVALIKSSDLSIYKKC